MINNCHYDLMETITIISKSLYRYGTYMKDASDCNYGAQPVRVFALGETVGRLHSKKCQSNF